MHKVIYQKQEKQNFLNFFETSIANMKANKIDFFTWNGYFKFFVGVLYVQTPTILYDIYANELINSTVICKTREEKKQYQKNIKEIKNYLALVEMNQQDNIYYR